MSDSESEPDFLNGRHAGGQAAFGDPLVVAIAAVEAREAEPRAAIQRYVAPPAKRRMQYMPAPAQRTADHHAMLSRAMHDGKKIKLHSNLASVSAAAEPPLSTFSRLGIAFSTSSRISTIAREYVVGREYVRNTTASVALAFVTMMQGFYSSCLQLARMKGITLFWNTLKFDETQQKLSLDSHPDLSRDQRLSAWPVLIQSRTVGWYCNGVRCEFGVPTRPVIMIGSKSAGCHWDGLFCQKSQQDLQTFIQEMTKLSDMSMSVRESDGASTNVKLLTHEMNQAAPNKHHLYSYMVCGLHQANHNTGALVKLVSSDIVAAMYAHANLLRMGNFWMRTILCIDLVVMKPGFFRVVFGPPSSVLRIFVGRTSVLIVCLDRSVIFGGGLLCLRFHVGVVRKFTKSFRCDYVFVPIRCGQHILA